MATMSINNGPKKEVKMGFLTTENDVFDTAAEADQAQFAINRKLHLKACNDLAVLARHDKLNPLEVLDFIANNREAVEKYLETLALRKE